MEKAITSKSEVKRCEFKGTWIMVGRNQRLFGLPVIGTLFLLAAFSASCKSDSRGHSIDRKAEILDENLALHILNENPEILKSPGILFASDGQTRWNTKLNVFAGKDTISTEERIEFHEALADAGFLRRKGVRETSNGRLYAYEAVNRPNVELLDDTVYFVVRQPLLNKVTKVVQKGYHPALTETGSIYGGVPDAVASAEITFVTTDLYSRVNGIVDTIRKKRSGKGCFDLAWCNWPALEKSSNILPRDFTFEKGKDGWHAKGLTGLALSMRLAHVASNEAVLRQQRGIDFVFVIGIAIMLLIAGTGIALVYKRKMAAQSSLSLLPDEAENKEQ